MSTNEMRKSDGTHRVVITGMGSVSPAGIGVMPLWSAVKEGRCCIGKVTKFDASGFVGSVAAEIPDFDSVACGLSKKEARRFAPFVQYAIVAADEAMAQSGDDPEKIVDERGMRQVSDAGALQPIVDQVLANCPDQAQQYRDGNQKVIGFLVGQCMKASRGSGNPKLFNELLRASLS